MSAADSFAEEIARIVAERLRDSMPQGGSRLVTVEMAAEYLSCSPAHVRNLITAGKLPCVKLGNGTARVKPFIDRRDLDVLIDQNKHREGKDAA